MMNRFFVYSLRHARPIRAWLEGEKKYRNITVIAMDEESVSYTVAGKKAPVTKAKGAFLAASYARGDNGDPVKFSEEETKT